MSIIHANNFYCLSFVLISKGFRPILLVNVLIFFSFKTWHLCYKVSVDKVNEVFPIGYMGMIKIVNFPI